MTALFVGLCGLVAASYLAPVVAGLKALFNDDSTLDFGGPL